MDLRQIQICLSVAQHLSFRLAAQSLGVSQSAISQQIQNLETSLGLRVFERNSQGVTLTEAGELMLPQLHELHARSETVRQFAQMLRRGESGRVCIGYSSSLMNERNLPLGLREYCDAYPEVHVDLRPLAVTSAVDLLLSGEIDIAVMRSPLPPLPGEFRSDPFGESQLLLALPIGHPLTGQAQVPWQSLDGQLMLMHEDPPGIGLRHVVETLLATHGVKIGSARQVSDTGMLVGLIAAGLGISILPAGIAQSHADVITRPLQGRPLFAGAAIAYRRNGLPLHVRRLISGLRKA